VRKRAESNERRVTSKHVQNTCFLQNEARWELKDKKKEREAEEWDG